MRSLRVALCSILVAACNGRPAEHVSEERDDLSALRGALPPNAVFVPELLRDGLAGEGAYKLMVELCTIAPHRLAGSEGAARAVEWAQKTMERVGLENVRLEPCQVPHWERGTLERLIVVEPALHAGEALSILALGGSVPTPADGLEADVMAVRSFEELHERSGEAQGKIVLFDRPMDPLVEPFEAYGGAVNQRSRGASEAADEGALAVLVRSMTLLTDDEPHTGSVNYDSLEEAIPAAAVSTRAADRIRSWLEAGERVRLRLALGCRWFEETTSHNVVGEIVGSERPGEIVLIGAHLDAWDVGQGAHDDGAGCAHVLEAARLIARPEFTLGRPRRTVRCVLFMNEENGLRGGLAYRDEHRSELGGHVLAIETDRGGSLPFGFTTDASGEMLERLRALFGVSEAGRGGGADVSPLAEFGVPLAGLYTDPQRYFDFHHSRHDTVDAVNPRELQLGAISLASMAWLAANHELNPRPRSE